MYVELVLDLPYVRSELARIQMHDIILLYNVSRRGLVQVVHLHLCSLVEERLYIGRVEELEYIRELPDVGRVSCEVPVYELEVFFINAQEERAAISVRITDLLEHDLLKLILVHRAEVDFEEHVLGEDADVFAEYGDLINVAVVNDE